MVDRAFKSTVLHFYSFILNIYFTKLDLGEVESYMFIGEFSKSSHFLKFTLSVFVRGVMQRRVTAQAVLKSRPSSWASPWPQRSRGHWVSCSLGSPLSQVHRGSLSLEMVITMEKPSWVQVASPTAWPGPELEVKTDSWVLSLVPRWSCQVPMGPQARQGRVLLPKNMEHPGIWGHLCLPFHCPYTII